MKVHEAEHQGLVMEEPPLIILVYTVLQCTLPNTFTINQMEFLPHCGHEGLGPRGSCLIFEINNPTFSQVSKKHQSTHVS